MDDYKAECGNSIFLNSIIKEEKAKEGWVPQSLSCSPEPNQTREAEAYCCILFSKSKRKRNGEYYLPELDRK